MRRRVSVLVLMMCTSMSLRAQSSVAARAWADSTSYLIGDPITVHVEIKHEGRLTFTPLVGDTAGVFHILSRDPFRKSDNISSTTLRVAAYDSGTAVLPPLQFSYSLPNDSTLRIVTTDSLAFVIHLVEVDTSKAIKDIKPVLGVPLTVAEISLVSGTLVGAGLLVYGIYLYRKRKKERTPEERYIPPAKPAHIVALEELSLLKEKRLWQQGLIKPYYSESTEIIRRYFENRFGFMAMEKTTDETMADLRQYDVAGSILDQTNKILRRADLVKFAKFEPSVPDHEDMLATAFDIVEKTKVIDAPQRVLTSDAEKTGEPAHV